MKGLPPLFFSILLHSLLLFLLVWVYFSSSGEHREVGSLLWVKLGSWQGQGVPTAQKAQTKGAQSQAVTKAPALSQPPSSQSQGGNSSVREIPGELGQGGDVNAPGGSGGGTLASGGTALGLIREKINRMKKYPEAALRRRIEGRVDLKFTLKKDGSLQWAQIVTSSGETFLDDEALATLKRAQPFPYLEGPIVVPVEFILKNP